MLTIQPVAEADFQYANQLMSEVFSTSSNQWERAQVLIKGYCDAKFNVGGNDSPAEIVQDSCQLFDALTARILYWAKFMRKNWGLLQNRGLINGNTIKVALEGVAAYATLDVDKDGFDPEELLAEVDRRLGREHIPVSQTEPKYPVELKEFLDGFAVLRTYATHNNWQTRTGTGNGDEELLREINGWIALNPVFTKQDLLILKEHCRKQGIPKKIWRGLIQAMRGKTYLDLCQMLLEYWTDEE